MALNFDLIRQYNRRALTQDQDQPPDDGLGPAPSPSPGPVPPSPAPVNTAGPAGIAPGPSAAPAPSPAPAPSGYNREALSQAIQGIQFGANPTYNPAEFIAQNQGGFAQGVTMVSPDKIRLPDGEIVDIGGDISADGTGGAWWGSERDWQARNAASGGALARAEAGAAGGGGGVTAAGGGGAGGSSDPLQQMLRQQLLRLMDQGNQPFDAESDPRAVAYRRARERGAGQERAQAAERAAFMGLNLGGQGSGGFETNLQGIREGAGEDIAGFEANLAGEEMQARRQQLMQSLDLANALGARTEAMALQRELANLDNQFRYASLAQQDRQFGEDFGLRKAQVPQDYARDYYLNNMRG